MNTTHKIVHPDAIKYKLDGLAKRMFGKSLSEAHRDGVCIKCHIPIGGELGKDDADEYELSGLCPTCFFFIVAPDPTPEDTYEPDF